jgi:hypothetical protein
MFFLYIAKENLSTDYVCIHCKSGGSGPGIIGGRDIKYFCRRYPISDTDTA